MKKILALIMMAIPVITVFLIQSCNKNSNELQSATITGAAAVQAPVSGVVLSDMELLGKKIFFDNISSPSDQSYASCHSPEYGFTGPVSGQNLKHGIYRGAVAIRFGNRKPPSTAYSTFSPVLHYDAGVDVFVGGSFSDGRATGETLGNPATEQALGPFLNPVEQNMPSKASVLKQIAASGYAGLWQAVWGEPVSYASADDIAKNYNRVGLSIAAYEASAEVSPFSSKFDFYKKGMTQLTEQEALGLELFNGKAQCNACHTSEGELPLFTDFTYDNLGVPRNEDNPFYQMNTVYINGQAINPLGSAWIDPGLGGFLENSGNSEWAAMAANNRGKHKVPTLRNVDKKPGEGNTKAFMHNGVFKSLKEVVDFYNTRDVKPWAPAEVSENMNTEELGNLQLSNTEVDAIVAFLKTLSDGYRTKNN